MLIQKVKPKPGIWVREMARPRGYWNERRCHEKALLFETRSEFQAAYKSADHAARRGCFIDRICSHMKPAGNLERLYIYIYEFSEDRAYIGLTCSLKRRAIEHKYHKEMGHLIDSGEFVLKTEGPFSSVDTKKREQELIADYKQKGFSLFNKNKGGSVGGGKTKWNEKTIQAEALKYTSRTDFQIKAHGAHMASIRLGIVEKIMSHMSYEHKPHRYWYEKKNVINEALKYTDRSEFKLKSPGASRVASIMGWTAEVTAHMPKKSRWANSPGRYRQSK